MARARARRGGDRDGPSFERLADWGEGGGGGVQWEGGVLVLARPSGCVRQCLC